MLLLYVALPLLYLSIALLYACFSHVIFIHCPCYIYLLSLLYLWMDGWMDVWMDGWVGGWIDNKRTKSPKL